MKKTISMMLVLLCVVQLFALSGSAAAAVEAKSTVTKDEKFGAAKVSLSQQEFEGAGFTLGDSCDIFFANGYAITDVPYYNGYYVKNGAPVLVAYPGAANVSITYNNMGIWDTAALTEGEAVTIQLNTAGKYAAVQDALGQVYSFDRADYASDTEFCNFRSLSGGRLKENFFFRGTSPVDNSRGRAAYTDQLLEEHQIQLVIDLADTMDDVAGYRGADDFASDYTASLCDQGKVILLGMGSAYQSEDYQQKLVSGLRQMLQTQGPVYIHCMEGKDRTGFVCMLLEALAGASYLEMRADYMLTYQNYYSVDPDAAPEKYKAISDLYFDAFTSYLLGTDAVEIMWDSDYTEAAAAYLRAGGMTDAEIAQLKTVLMGE